MNFILNNKLAIFLIFIIFYCLFNYRLKEGLASSRIIKNRKTGEMRFATKKEITDADANVASAMEARKINEAKSLGAAGRLVENIDGKKGQAIEQAAADEMRALATSKQQATEVATKQNAAKQATKLASENVSKETQKMKKIVKKMQDDAASRAKKLTNKLQSFGESVKDATPFGLASQGESFNGVVGAGCRRGASSKELRRQRNNLASELPCEERCKTLYGKNTAHLCESNNCVCKINREYIYRGQCEAAELERGEA